MILLKIFLFNFIFFTNLAHAKLHIVLDAGHGGDDTGSIHTLDGQKISEKDITLQFVNRLAIILNKRKILTTLTRTDDNVVLLDKRTSVAKSFVNKQNLTTAFVSIHLNSNKDTNISGFETYVFNATTNEASQHLAEIENGSHRVSQKGTLSLIFSDLTATANYADSVELACSIHHSVFDSMKKQYPMRAHFTKNRGVKKGLFYVLMDSQVPSILIELGFGSNVQDLTALMNPTYQNLVASGIAQGLIDWAVFNKAKNQKRLAIASSGIQKNTKAKSRYAECIDGLEHN